MAAWMNDPGRFKHLATAESALLLPLTIKEAMDLLDLLGQHTTDELASLALPMMRTASVVKEAMDNMIGPNPGSGTETV